MVEVRSQFACPPEMLNRDKVTNGKRLLNGTDQRSPHGRRFRALVQSIADDLGGMASLTEPDRVLVKQAAALMVRAEALQTAIVNGTDVDDDEVIRITGAASRIIERLRHRAAEKPQPAQPTTLGAYLASAS
jgi:hypothetical protein